MMDLVSGAEVPAEEIAVSPAMIEAMVEAWRISAATLSLHETFSALYRAAVRARRAEIGGVERSDEG